MVRTFGVPCNTVDRSLTKEEETKLYSAVMNAIDRGDRRYHSDRATNRFVWEDTTNPQYSTLRPWIAASILQVMFNGYELNDSELYSELGHNSFPKKGISQSSVSQMRLRLENMGFLEYAGYTAPTLGTKAPGRRWRLTDKALTAPIDSLVNDLFRVCEGEFQPPKLADVIISSLAQDVYRASGSVTEAALTIAYAVRHRESRETKRFEKARIAVGGYIYAILIHETNTVKIGVTTDVGKQLSLLRNSSKHSTELVFVKRTEDAHAEEERIHRELAQEWIVTDYFRMSAATRAFLVMENDGGLLKETAVPPVFRYPFINKTKKATVIRKKGNRKKVEGLRSTETNGPQSNISLASAEPQI